MKQYYFLAGIPRSGSTVLASILNQNPSVYATPTSPLLDLLYLNEQAWRWLPSVIANPMPAQLEAISQAIIDGCWEHVPQSVIIDKHRAWCRNLASIGQIFKIPPKLIITVRDIPSVVASFLSLLRNSKQRVTYIDSILITRGVALTDANRARVLWNDFIKDPWDSFKTAWEKDSSALCLVDYDELVNSPCTAIDQVYSFLGLPKYTHDFNNIENKSVDDDLLAWGLENLHTIRPHLGKVSKSPKEILGDALFDEYSSMNLEFWRK